MLNKKIEEMTAKMCKMMENLKNSTAVEIQLPKPEKSSPAILEKIYERPLNLVIWKDLEDLHLENPDSIYLQQLVFTNFFLLAKLPVPKWLKMINSAMNDYLQTKYGSNMLPNLHDIG